MILPPWCSMTLTQRRINRFDPDSDLLQAMTAQDLRSDPFCSASPCHRVEATVVRRAFGDAAQCGSESQIVQRRIVGRADAEGLVKKPIRLSDRSIVDRPRPLPTVGTPFIREADGDPITAMRPHLLEEAGSDLKAPFARQKSDDLLAPGDELCPVSPEALLGVRQEHLLGITAVPGVFGHPSLLDGRIVVGGRERWL